jgi:hypothetical protein
MRSALKSHFGYLTLNDKRSFSERYDFFYADTRRPLSQDKLPVINV